MSAPTLIVLLVALLAVFALPRRWASVPFLVVACYIPRPERLDLGPFSFTTLRILTVAALLRAALRRDWKELVPDTTDYLMLLWAAVLVGTVSLHRDPSTQVVERLGLALDGLGLYFVFRLFTRSQDDIAAICGALAVVVIPLAALMLYEKTSGHNLLSFFGGIPAAPQVRNGSFRAQGPFRHSILAGTVGAISVPFVATLWSTRRRLSAIGLVACFGIVISSTSSGPLVSLLLAVTALSLWPFRGHLRLIRWSTVVLYLLLDMVMHRPAYYLMADVDLTGSSDAWHRARLIQSSIEHLNEWWLAGTDYTRHWMPTGVTWSPDQTDLTNHYIALGVYGGLPLVLTFVAIGFVSFRRVGRQLALERSLIGQRPFLTWAIGSALFAIAVTGLSVSFFDQSILWLYMSVAFCTALSNRFTSPTARRPLTQTTTAATHRSRRRQRRLSRPQALRTWPR